MEPRYTWEQAVLSFRSKAENKAIAEACFYDDPLLSTAQRFLNSTEWIALKNFLPENTGSVLEIGAGRGIASHAFAQTGWKTTALEPDPSSIVGAGAIRQLALDTELNINVVEEWGEKLPFSDLSFDLVYCRAVLHHAHDLDKLVSEVYRVLKPGGLFIAVREHVVNTHDEISVFQAAHPLHNLYGGEYAYLLSEYVDALLTAGFIIKTVLNPLESDINLYPSNQALLKSRLANKLGISFISRCIPNFLLRFWGSRMTYPGRLYSFVSYKQCHEK